MFKDREEAGGLLARKLEKTIGNQGFVVVALLRGGIVLGKKVADYCKIPMFPLSVKKIGAPYNPELAIGAITADKTVYLDKNLIKELGVRDEYLKEMSEIKALDAQKLQSKFKNKISLENKKVVIVDDGVAIGATAICASFFSRKHNAAKIILATPVIGDETLRNIKTHFDEVVFLKVAKNLGAVGEFYEYFPQITDEEVKAFL